MFAFLIQRIKESNKVGYLFVAPFVVYFSIFFAYPLIFSLYLTFHKWSIISPLKPYVGLQNYAKLITDSLFKTTIGNTISFLVMFVVGAIIISLGIAMMLNTRIRFRGAFRILYFLPIVTLDVAVALVWSWIFSSDYGLLNHFLLKVGVTPQGWLINEKLAMLSIAITCIWRWIGYFTIIFLAALQTIPKEYHEAAMLDGANSWHIFRHVTLPLLNPMITLAIIVATINGLQLFTEPYLMTKGGPSNSTLSIVYYMYNTGFRYLTMGYASTIGIALFVFIMMVVLLERKVLERRIEY